MKLQPQATLVRGGMAVLRARPRWLKQALEQVGLTRYVGRWASTGLRALCTCRTQVYPVRDFRMHLYRFDVGGISQAYSTEFWDRWSGVAQCLRAVLREGMVVVDLGAHVGFYTILAAQAVGRSGRVYAFEPEPRNYLMLKKNVELNRLENVITANLAVCDREGSTALFLGMSSVDHTLYCPKQDRNAITVKTVTLDAFFKDQPARVDVLRMNIEGAEPQVIHGMDNLLAANPHIILLTEFNPEAIQAAGSRPEDFLDEVVRRGFYISRIVDDAPGELRPVDGMRSVLLNALGVANLLLTSKGEPLPSLRMGEQPASSLIR